MSTLSTSDYASQLEVGFIAKAHGIVGEVIVHLTTNRAERVAPGSILFADVGGTGERVELEVDYSKAFHGKQSQSTDQSRWIVKFHSWATRNAAEMLHGSKLFAAPLEDPDVIWVHQLVGRRVVDQTGIDRGEVLEIEANPASDLLVLDTGKLVPIRFLEMGPDGERNAAGQDVDEISTPLRVIVPEGLFD
ncbi:MAG TPA: hypothetical protein VMU77_00150 [Acidimicrobiales bacterium]|nr:hypothetical protein [Acidimicrobiales bacterium]